MAEIPEKDETFGEKVELPEGYLQFWKEYQQVLAEGDGTLGKPLLCDWIYSYENKKHLYLNRRISFLLPEYGSVREGDKDKLVISLGLPNVPVIPDIYTYHWMRGDVYGESTIPESSKKETIITLSPEIETVLSLTEIRRYRKVSPELEFIPSCHNNRHVGNPSKVGVLLDLFDDYYASQEKSWQEHRVHGNELLSIPSSYPLEKEIAGLYEKIGRHKFDLLTERYFDLRRALCQARKIDPYAVAGLEKSVEEQYEVMRKEILVQL